MQLPRLMIRAVALPTAAFALGINCRGSSQCMLVSTSDASEAIQGYIQAAIDTGSGGNFYHEGKQIGCKDSICAFYQSGASGDLNDAITHINNIVNHGCGNCGSDPTQPGNDVSKGELTVNYVSSPTCTNGLCDPA
ncbi:hypothetical protein N7537_004546 [Penicillium hordei]|uniref:Killer toxin Kp4 domain-containing protein n=1 Tax=Penicillium hordei TaxID=40994 RepID=A0AAD6ECR4_9EURO|nr:uncharacterized protein N7537_004546 [Penicillium hordei]KAJ5607927.1 hypothetical protein N7537_004546 [Penicillium hordei]